MLAFTYVTKTAAEPTDLAKSLNPLSPTYMTHWSSHQKGYKGVPAQTEKDLNFQLSL